MTLILRKIGPCTCQGLCNGECKATNKKVFDIQKILKRIYCINLPASVERRKAMETMLKIFNKADDSSKYPSIIFIKAISPNDKTFNNIRTDAKKIDNGYIPRCYCFSGDNSLCKKHAPRSLREVEIAISISHLQTYQLLLKNGDKLALICEDDIILLSNTVNILSKLLEPIKDDLFSDKPIIIFCGGAKNNKGLKVTDPSQFMLKSSENGVYSNYAYILNNAGAQVLKKNAFPINRPDDSYKRYLIAKNKLVAYQIVPSLVAELSSGVNSPAIYNRLSKKTSIEALERCLNNEKRIIKELKLIKAK
jgi:GR25 family glycosyltransferase involved in LPS biosynthesis